MGENGKKKKVDRMKRRVREREERGKDEEGLEGEKKKRFKC